MQTFCQCSFLLAQLTKDKLKDFHHHKYPRHIVLDRLALLEMNHLTRYLVEIIVLFSTFQERRDQTYMMPLPSCTPGRLGDIY